MGNENGEGTMTTVRHLAVAILAAGMIASPAWAGLVMVYEEESFGRPGKETTTMYMGKDRMRTETGRSGTDEVFIFRGDRNLFWMIDAKEGTYTEITKEDMKRLKGRMDEARRSYEEQMKQIPPEQRRMMESMMKGRMPQQPEKTTYRKAASGVRVNRWICDRYDGYRGTEKKEEVWTADPGQFNIRPEEIKVFDDARAFMEEISKEAMPFVRVDKDAGRKGGDYSGVPVRVIRYANGEKREWTELSEVSHKDVPPALFELPAGVKKKDMPR